MTKFEQIKHLEERYETLDSELDHMCWKSEVGLEVDMEDWYRTIGKMVSIQRELAGLREQSNPDVELFSPDDTQPEPEEPEYDEYTEWVQMTSELRRGEG